MNILRHLLLLALLSPLAAQEKRDLILVVSEPGESEYADEFARQAETWKTMAAKAKMDVTVIGQEGDGDDDRVLLEKAVGGLDKDGGDFWLVWIGHGSFDGRTANFNLRGEDIGVERVKELLAPFERRLVLLHLFSASAPFVKELSGENRIIVGANQNAGEKNYVRFGEKFADALASPDADLDLDESLSLLEAFLFASGATREFYEDAQRVVQEHAVIDDNGDGRATPADAFKGLRGTGDAPDGAEAREVYFLKAVGDGLDDEARERRAEIEKEIEDLRGKKEELGEEEYYRQLEVLMRRMAGVYGAGE